MHCFSMCGTFYLLYMDERQLRQLHLEVLQKGGRFRLVPLTPLEALTKSLLRGAWVKEGGALGFSWCLQEG